MKIGIDFDGVMNNMLETWVEWLNKEHGAHVKAEDVTEWELSKKYPYLDKSDLFKPLNTPEFWDEVTIKHEAPEVVEKLIAEGHEVYVITSTHYKILPYKFKRSLFAHFPYLTKENLIVTYNKALINVDLLLDDGVHNLKDFRGIKVVFDAPYNRDFEGDYRVATWKEFYILVSGLARGNIFNTPDRVKQFKAGRGGGKTAWLHEQIFNTEGECYVIMDDIRFRHFCESYMERYHKVCPAKQFEFRKPIFHDTTFFVDMPSQFSIKSDAFEAFKTVFIDRCYNTYIADFENTFWHTV